MPPKRKRRPAPKPPRPTKRGDAGALPSNFAKPIRWKIDQDYVDKLSPDDREWLAAFNDRYYGGDYRGADQTDWPQELRRAVWTDVRASRVDCHTLANLGGALSLFSEDGTGGSTNRTAAPAPQPDLTPTPVYLSGEEYKAALAAYRAELVPTREYREPPDTLAKRRAAKRLAKLTPTPPETDPTNGQTDPTQN